jgi:hypothetical protein
VNWHGTSIAQALRQSAGLRVTVDRVKVAATIAFLKATNSRITSSMLRTKAKIGIDQLQFKINLNRSEIGR